MLLWYKTILHFDYNLCPISWFNKTKYVELFSKIARNRPTVERQTQIKFQAADLILTRLCILSSCCTFILHTKLSQIKQRFEK